ncbi:MAG: MBL fold metallo-hydrolase [Eubacterium sp.]|nr:MBL fold metallo-hydrolase [Eubacterium sp.]
MRLLSIASGSSGNCIYIGSDDTHILIDAGISGKKIEEGLLKADLSPRDISGICVTHEHIDHIKGLGVIARKYGIPMYMTEGTKNMVLATSSVGKIDQSLCHTVSAENRFSIGDIEILPMEISHDAAEPVAYLAYSGTQSAGVVTDLGIYTDHQVELMQGLDILLLEANHDVRMLEMGPYPYPLKQRILGNKGHLSNETSGKLLGRVLHDNFGRVVLGHLSHENNMAELAYETVRAEITLGDCPYKGDDFPIDVARRDCPSEVYTV